MWAATHRLLSRAGLAAEALGCPSLGCWLWTQVLPKAAKVAAQTTMLRRSPWTFAPEGHEAGIKAHWGSCEVAFPRA